MKKFLKILFTIVLVIVIVVGLALGALTALEYRPAPAEEAPLQSGAAKTLQPGQSLRLLSWNVGYAGLGAESDFFMDGGKDTRSADRETVQRYLDGISATVKDSGAELVLLQEVDRDSTRSYRIDEAEAILAALGGQKSSSFAKNFSVAFVPYPVPPIGKVESGLFTVSDYEIGEAARVALPCPFSWPLRIANLKRCLLVSRLPVEGTDKQLVLVNLHLEAYDDGEGKIAQTRQLTAFLEAEYARGNYVVAGGDFNQVFPASTNRYPIFTPELWSPGVFQTGVLPDGLRFVSDYDAPSCRLLNAPYDAETAQHYVIDGFILSKNVRLEAVETLDLGFENSDHNPVSLRVTLE